MVQLGAAGQRLFGDKYFPGLGSVVHGIGLVLAFLLWGYGFWYLIIAILSVATTHKKQGIPFNMGWWGLTFPIGVYTAGTFAIGDTLDSMAFHVFGAILTVVLVIIWLSIMAKTIVGAWSGEMFSAPCLTPVVLRQ
jgi:tellurite resistance protein TehA-like permease